MSELTHVELVWIRKRIENRIRFGRIAEQHVIDRQRRVVSFMAGSIFAFVRSSANDYGTVVSRIDILRAVAPGERYATVPYVRPDAADERAFAERCRDDRHHFRFIVSPEDAAKLHSLRTFTRELMADAERDLGTRLDWVAVDHWNTDNPHVHVLIRGRADDGKDLVISRDYISRGVRHRAAERVTLELGPRSEHEIRSALAACRTDVFCRAAAEGFRRSTLTLEA